MIRRLALAAALFVSATTLLACGPTYPNCRNDDQCHDREVCVNGTCQQCRADTDCAYGQHCENGACVATSQYECRGDADCAPGQACQANRCVTVATSTDPGSLEGADDDACGRFQVFFAYDEATLASASRDAIAEGARCMAGAHASDVAITGMTDPRGTEEYNLTLGERRAHSVADYLARMGVDRSRIRTNSVGEEYSEGTDEGSWSHDRRADVAPR